MYDRSSSDQSNRKPLINTPPLLKFNDEFQHELAQKKKKSLLGLGPLPKKPLMSLLERNLSYAMDTSQFHSMKRPMMQSTWRDPINKEEYPHAEPAKKRALLSTPGQPWEEFEEMEIESASSNGLLPRPSLRQGQHSSEVFPREISNPPLPSLLKHSMFERRFSAEDGFLPERLNPTSSGLLPRPGQPTLKGHHAQQPQLSPQDGLLPHPQEMYHMSREVYTPHDSIPPSGLLPLPHKKHWSSQMEQQKIYNHSSTSAGLLPLPHSALSLSHHGSIQPAVKSLRERVRPQLLPSTPLEWNSSMQSKHVTHPQRSERRPLPNQYVHEEDRAPKNGLLGHPSQHRNNGPQGMLQSMRQAHHMQSSQFSETVADSFYGAQNSPPITGYFRSYPGSRSNTQAREGPIQNGRNTNARPPPLLPMPKQSFETFPLHASSKPPLTPLLGSHYDHTRRINATHCKPIVSSHRFLGNEGFRHMDTNLHENEFQSHSKQGLLPTPFN